VGLDTASAASHHAVMKTAHNNSTQISSLDSLIHGVAISLANSIVDEMRKLLPGDFRQPAEPRRQVANAAPRRPRGGRLARRTAEDIGEALARVQGILKAGPMRAEDIRAKLDLPSKAMPRILKTGLANGMLKSTGQKRATAYSLTPVKVAKAAKPAKSKPAKDRKTTTVRKTTKRTAKKNVAVQAVPAAATEITAPETVLGS
jgi:pyruvate/2-oxoglutarate dehydrogenase complex dihydrolipoamide acyltransferase (E2) component